MNSALSLGSVKRDGSLASMNSTSADSVSSLSRSHATNLAGSSEMPGTATGMTASREAGEAVVMPTLKEEESGRLEQSAPSKKLTSPMASTSPFRNIDAAVLIYDLDRMETFNRLESHWLPLIERCYSGEVRISHFEDSNNMNAKLMIAFASMRFVRLIPVTGYCRW